MRVLFITSSYPSHRDDPRGIFIHRLARGFRREGVQVTVIAPGVPSAPACETLDGVEVQRPMYWIRRWQRLGTEPGGILPTLRRHPWLLLQVPPLVAALTRRALSLAPAFDVIHAHWLYPAGIAGVIAAKRWDIPLIVTGHGSDLNLATDWRAIRLIVRQISRAADACVGVSRALCEQFVAIGVPSERVRFISSIFDPQNELPLRNGETSAALQLFRAFEGFRLLYVGSLIQGKSVETLLDAHHDLQRRGHPVACAIVGVGPDRSHLDRIVRGRSQPNVLFVGAQPPYSVPMWMSSAHLLIHPSLSEGRPNVILEAMMLGLPVVATEIPGTTELVLDRATGLLFPPRDVKKLADCIEELMGDQDLREAIGRRARGYIQAEGITVAQAVRHHIALYEQLCAVRKQEPLQANSQPAMRTHHDAGVGQDDPSPER